MDSVFAYDVSVFVNVMLVESVAPAAVMVLVAVVATTTLVVRLQQCKPRPNKDALGLRHLPDARAGCCHVGCLDRQIARAEGGC